MPLLLFMVPLYLFYLRSLDRRLLDFSWLLLLPCRCSRRWCLCSRSLSRLDDFFSSLYFEWLTGCDVTAVRRKNSSTSCSYCLYKDFNQNTKLLCQKKAFSLLSTSFSTMFESAGCRHSTDSTDKKAHRSWHTEWHRPAGWSCQTPTCSQSSAILSCREPGLEWCSTLRLNTPRKLST